MMEGLLVHILAIKFYFKYNGADLKGFEQRSDKLCICSNYSKTRKSEKGGLIKNNTEDNWERNIVEWNISRVEFYTIIIH